MAEQHEKALVPQIRFTGFTDPWEQRKLEDYVVVSTAKNVDGRFNKEDVLSVSGEYGIVNQIAFQGRSFAGSSVLNYGIVNTGDIVYTKSPLNSNPYGIIKVNKGIPGIVSTLYAVYRPQDNVHTNFIQVYFEQHERMNNYMHPLVNKGAKNDMKVTAENALKGVVTFPSREEQVIISEFFDRLDSLITLHQRKYDKLCVLKKSMLDKMFPKGGSLYPEIRFAGFTNHWEQRKLGEVAHFINGRAYSQNELLSSGKYPVLRVGNFYTNDSWYYSNLELEDKNYAYEGDLLYTWSATFGPHIWHGNKVIYHYHIWKVQLEAAFEKLFAFQLLERDKERILSDKNGSTMVHITKIGIENTSVLMPCSVIEQRQIGAFFDRLDSLITLHQRKLELLRNIKKSMLDKMFV
ncbi:restriction endonuclease subunit S [Bifidobacterium adolescentis]|nr:restriction endonuclease subunit S [Bifidobacterium adolescentis]MDB1533954.1 restriction endonuclease subunit S [Bifidobacterium adolescentis]